MGSTVKVIRSKTTKTVKTKSSETKQVQKPVEYDWGKGNTLGSK
jgi:hypothetical protein